MSFRMDFSISEKNIIGVYSDCTESANHFAQY